MKKVFLIFVACITTAVSAQERSGSIEHEYVCDSSFVWNPDKICAILPDMDMDFRLPYEKDPSGVANLLFRNSQSGKVQLLDTIIDGRRHYRPLEPVFYDVILLYNNGKYVIYDNLKLDKRANIVVNMATRHIRLPDDDSRQWLTMRKFTDAVEERTNDKNDERLSDKRVLGYMLDSGDLAHYSLHGQIVGSNNGAYDRRATPINLSDDGYFEFDLEDGYNWRLDVVLTMYVDRIIHIESNIGLFIYLEQAPIPENIRNRLVGMNFDKDVVRF
jgi:hypothetical protein